MKRRHMQSVLRSGGTLLSALLLALTCATLPARAEIAAAHSPSALGFSSERLDRIDSGMEALIRKQRLVGGHGLVARNGRIVYDRTWGHADREAQRPVQADTLYRIYSMTKPVTAVALLMLYEEGRFLLNDPVARYIPELSELTVLGDEGERAASRQPTILDLLRHTAGFSYGIFGDTEVDRGYIESGLLEAGSLAEFVSILGEQPLLLDPGKRWHYSVAVDVQGRLVEVLAGMPFGAFLEQRIFDPLGMDDTGFRLGKGSEDRLAQLYIPADGTSGWSERWHFGSADELVPADPALTEPYLDGSLFESGGAGLLSTAHDYMRFGMMLLNGGELEGVRLLSPETVRLMRTDFTGDVDTSGIWSADGFGLGLGRFSPQSTGELGPAWAYGWGGAAGTDFWIDPENNIVGVFMMQTIASAHAPRSSFRVLVYQALTGSSSDTAGD